MNPFTHSLRGSRSSLQQFVTARPALLTFFVCVILGSLVVVWRARRSAESARSQARSQLLVRSLAIESMFARAGAAVEILGALATQTGGRLPQFPQTAAELLASHPGIANLEWQPDGVTSAIAPRAGNERALGANTLADPSQRAAAQAAIHARRLILIGPLRLPHGDPGLAFRLPIFQREPGGKERFWGFVSASIRLADIEAQARLDDLRDQGYDCLLFRPPSASHKSVVLATRGKSTFTHAVQQSIRAPGAEFRLAVQPRAGWIRPVPVILNSLALLVLAGLLGWVVAVRVASRRLAAPLADANARLADEATERQRMQEELQAAYAEGAALQARLDQAEQTVGLFQERLKSVTRSTHAEAETSDARLQQAEAALAELQARAEAAERAAETAEASQVEVTRATSTIRQLQSRLDAVADAAGQTEQRHAEAIAQAGQRFADLQSELANATAVAEAVKYQLAQTEEALRQREAQIAELTARCAASQAAAETSAPPIPPDPPAEATATGNPAPEATASSSPKRAKSRNRRRPPKDDQLGLFGEDPSPAESASREIVEAAAAAPAHEPLPPPEDMVSPPASPIEEAGPEVEPSPSAEAIPDSAEPDRTEKERERENDSLPEAEPAVDTDRDRHEASPAGEPDLSAVPGLAAPEGLRYAGGDAQAYLTSVRHFVELHSRSPERIRDLLVQGDTAAAAQALTDLNLDAETIGATVVHTAGTALERALRAATAPDELETLWADLETAVNALLDELGPVAKRKSGKTAPARGLPPPPVDPGELRTTVKQMLPLLADRDPGAKDCLRDNRTTFRSAFSPSAFVEFEQTVKRGNFNAALEQLKKAARKHGIPI